MLRLETVQKQELGLVAEQKLGRAVFIRAGWPIPSRVAFVTRTHVKVSDQNSLYNLKNTPRNSSLPSVPVRTPQDGKGARRERPNWGLAQLMRPAKAAPACRSQMCRYANARADFKETRTPLHVHGEVFVQAFAQ